MRHTTLPTFECPLTAPLTLSVEGVFLCLPFERKPLQMLVPGLCHDFLTLLNGPKNPEFYQAVMSLSVEELPQHDVLLSIKRIKQRNLKSEFQELGSQGSMEERLRARLEHRKKQKELVDLIGNPSLT